MESFHGNMGNQMPVGNPPHKGDGAGKRSEKTMANVAAEMMLQCVFDERLSMSDMNIERRPYHKNCSCALHKQKAEQPNTCVHSRNISFPQKAKAEIYNFVNSSFPILFSIFFLQIHQS
ncbi:hypothetical protein RND71_009343 [Anisodus tanguticus]|uniref:Uncharacterized protein n=1 Tax=Anisodus tanguticus TaxID=243964 RepID=A0AAE1SF95_9SOLA|nr:hypothetical protein RND71_009343 [Anisodus tanguticus]